MTSLVTGASGVLGSALVDALASRGETVIAASRRPPATEERPRVRWVALDLATDQNWSRILESVDVVYHLAWSSVPNIANANPAHDVLVNLVGTLRLLEQLRSRPGMRFVFASSGGTVYGPPVQLPIPENHVTRPIGAYGISKLAVEGYLDMFAREHGLNPVSLRVSNLFGPAQMTGRQFGAISTFCASAIEGRPITIFGDGSIIRDYIYISDVVDAFIAAGRSNSTSRAINVGTGEGRSLLEILKTIESFSNKSIEVRFLESRAFDVASSILDVKQARNELGWRPLVPFETAVANTYQGLLSRLIRD